MAGYRGDGANGILRESVEPRMRCCNACSFLRGCLGAQTQYIQGLIRIGGVVNRGVTV